MARIILVTGSGGAGKSSVAAATALAAARRGVRTVVLASGVSPGLGSVFGVEAPLFSGPRGAPVAINDHLSIHEVDVSEELRLGWNSGQGGLAALVGGGLAGAGAEEVAVTAEAAHVVTLLRLGEYVREQRHDLIVVDCGSTTEALGLVTTVSAMSWYARRQQTPAQPGRRARLLAASLQGAEASLEVRDRLKAVDELLHDPEVTALRLVTAADTASVQEVQRAYTYFNLHGVAVDCVVINRLAPTGAGGASGRAQAQQSQVEKLQGAFTDVLVLKVPEVDGEVVGEKPLEAFAEQLYQGEDPVRLGAAQPLLGLRKDAVDVYHLEVRLPFVAKSDVSLSRRGEELVIQVGGARRNVVLPRMVAQLPTSGARMEGDRLVVSFQRERSV